VVAGLEKEALSTRLATSEHRKTHDFDPELQPGRPLRKILSTISLQRIAHLRSLTKVEPIRLHRQ